MAFLGAGPSSHFPRHARHAPTETGHHFPQRRRNARRFGMQQDGSQYRRLIASVQRIFGATTLFGTDTQRERAMVTHQTRFNFMREARMWYSRDPNQTALPGGFENEIVLSDEFFREVTTHSIPTDLEAAKILSSSPAALDLFTWLSYRCFTAKGPERVPVFGDLGPAGQLGSADCARPRRLRERLERLLDLLRASWPSCLAQLSTNGVHMVVQPAIAVAAKGAWACIVEIAEFSPLKTRHRLAPVGAVRLPKLNPRDRMS
jgi:hypothetical protein